MSQFPPAGPPPATTPPNPQWGQPPVPGAVSPYAPPKTEGMAVAALVLSIASWVVCPVIAAVVALALAHAAGNRIDASAGQRTGTGLVTAAKIVAWIHLVLITLVMVAIAIALVAADAS
jgi:uncharacterized protein DUF4190